MLTSCDIFLPAATIGYTRSAERKQSDYCVPLEWPAPILRAPTPPAMTTRGIDMHCCCICASAILWSPQVVPCASLFYQWSYMWWLTMISCLISVLFESSLLWSCCCEMMLHNRLHMPRLRAMCVAGGQRLTVSSLVSLFIYPCTFNQQWNVERCCVWLLVLSLFDILLTAAYCSSVQWHLWCIALGITVAL